MTRFQVVGADELKEMLVQRGLWSKIQSGKLLAKEDANDPSKAWPGGTSYVISYYDERLHYLCTVHRILDKDGANVHEHVKDAYLDGVRYRARAR
jgi:hypothetical protein